MMQYDNEKSGHDGQSGQSGQSPDKEQKHDADGYGMGGKDKPAGQDGQKR